MFDTHMHSDFSTDSNMKIKEAIKKGKELDLGIIITDHMDLNYPNKEEFKFDPKKYFNEYSSLRCDKVLLGIEIGMCNKYSKEYENLCKNNPFDYVIGSIHDMYDVDLYYATELYKSMSKKNFYEEYFNHTVKCIKEHTFINSLGHIDYLARCAQYEDSEIYYEEFHEYIDDVLKTLIKNDILLELNTRRLNNKEAISNLIKIYKRYEKLGGKYVTIGSDAHDSKIIGNNFKEALEIVRICDLKNVYFEERKIKFL